MPTFGFWGAHMQMEKFPEHPCLAILFEFKPKSNELKTTWHSKSSHGITSTYNTTSLEVIGPSKVTSWNIKLLLGCYSSPLPTQDLVPCSKHETTLDRLNGDDLHTPMLLPSPNDV